MAKLSSPACLLPRSDSTFMATRLSRSSVELDGGVAGLDEKKKKTRRKTKALRPNWTPRRTSIPDAPLATASGSSASRLELELEGVSKNLVFTIAGGRT